MSESIAESLARQSEFFAAVAAKHGTARPEAGPDSEDECTCGPGEACGSCYAGSGD